MSQRLVFAVVFAAFLAAFCAISSGAEASADVRSLLIPSETSPARGVGRVVRIDGVEITFEDASNGAPSHTSRSAGGSVVFLQAGESSAADLSELAASALAEFDRISPRAGSADAVLFRNGDGVACEFIGMNRRYAYFRCFGRVSATPRERVAGVRFGAASAR